MAYKDDVKDYWFMVKGGVKVDIRTLTTFALCVPLGHTKIIQTCSVARGYVSGVLLIDLGCVRDRGLQCCAHSRMPV